MLKQAKTDDFDEIYKIMEESFPFDEIRSYTGQKSLLSNPNYKIYVVNNEHLNEIKCFIALYEFDAFLFVEHFATNKKYRNMGLGSKMLNELSDIKEKAICLEVELPQTNMAKRRIEFYKRNGFFYNDFPYFQPPIEKGKKPVPLRIMSYGKKLSKNEFDNVISVIYKQVYNAN